MAKKKKKKKSQRDRTSIVLWAVLGVLFCIVIALFLQVLHVKEEEKLHPKANMSIPIRKLGDSAEFHITTLGLSKDDGYVFKITNYSLEEINEEEIPYEIIIENSSNSTIEIEKLNSDQKWTMKKSLTIEEETLGTEEKQDVFYRVKVIKSKKLNAKDLITVRIHS